MTIFSGKTMGIGCLEVHGSMGEMKRSKVQRIGDSLGVVLPEEVLEHLGVEEGDELALIGMQHACLLLRPGNKFQRIMRHATECMNRYASTLRDLSK